MITNEKLEKFIKEVEKTDGDIGWLDADEFISRLGFGMHELADLGVVAEFVEDGRPSELGTNYKNYDVCVDEFGGDYVQYVREVGLNDVRLPEPIFVTVFNLDALPDIRLARKASENFLKQSIDLIKSSDREVLGYVTLTRDQVGYLRNTALEEYGSDLDLLFY